MSLIGIVSFHEGNPLKGEKCSLMEISIDKRHELYFCADKKKSKRSVKTKAMIEFGTPQRRFVHSDSKLKRKFKNQFGILSFKIV